MLWCGCEMLNTPRWVEVGWGCRRSLNNNDMWVLDCIVVEEGMFMLAGSV